MHSLWRPGHLPDRRLLGRPPGAARGLAAAAAGADRDPRQRRRHRRPRLRPLLPRHRRRRGRDRRRADRARPPLLRPRATRGCATFAEDARPWLRALRRRLRRDHGRRLPPALHPLLPGHPRVLRAGPGAAWRRAGSSIVNVGHPEGSDELERVLGRTMAAAFPRVLRYPIEPTNTLLVGGDGDFSAARLRAQRRRAAAGAAAAGPRRGRRARRRGCRAARSTPTTAPRSSGWSTAPCWNTRMNESGAAGSSACGLAGDRPARARPRLRDRLRRGAAHLRAARRTSDHLGSVVR